MPIAGNGDGDNLVGEATIEGFDLAGMSLGKVAVSGGGSFNVSGRFGDDTLSEFIAAARDGDYFRIDGLTSTPCQ